MEGKQGEGPFEDCFLMDKRLRRKRKGVGWKPHVFAALCISQQGDSNGLIRERH